MRLPQLAADKANHVIYGAAVFCVAAAFAGEHARIAGMAAAVALAIAKEAADWLRNRRVYYSGMPAPHSVEWRDALATVAGAGLCLGASLLP